MLLPEDKAAPASSDFSVHIKHVLLRCITHGADTPVPITGHLRAKVKPWSYVPHLLTHF